MKYQVEIRRNSDGLLRRYEMTSDHPWVDDEPDGTQHDSWWWTEGNGGCDCNRALFFKRAGGEPDEDDETPCGDSLYSVVKVILPDGREVRIDSETVSKA